jgi:hypothetical protein
LEKRCQGCHFMKCVHLLPADVKAEVENRDENIRSGKKGCPFRMFKIELMKLVFTVRLVLRC